MREPVDLQYLQSLDFEDELRTIHAKVSEFKEIVGDCRADCYISPSQYARVTSRLRHLNCRFADLVSSSRVKGDKLSLLEGFRDQIADLMQTATELHSSTNVVPNDPELPPVSHARNPPVTASVDTAPSDAPGPSSLGHHFQQPSGPCEIGLHPTVSSQCARLPNPIERILSQQPVLSGDTFGSVLTFLKLLVEVKVHALILGVSDVHILLVLYPYTVGTLSNQFGVFGR
jgi:hypothetical protein